MQDKENDGSSSHWTVCHLWAGLGPLLQGCFFDETGLGC